ncbi:hypothetical protein B0H13DRAFT_2371092 [Mycena leptocephala]|nr:hypothetical protein B0H13DRAFT_2371092 [Mycena leptocephala]
MLTKCSYPSHHLAALSPHDDTDSNSNHSPTLPPSVALSSHACPKPSFFRGPKPSMPKVEDMSIWLHWAVDPASTLRVLLLSPLLALPTHFLLPLLRLYLLLPLQPVGNLFAPFFLSHPTPALECLSTAVVRHDTALPQRPGPRIARLQRCLLFILSAHAEPQPVPDAGAEVANTEGGEGGAVWGAGVCGGESACLFVIVSAPLQAIHLLVAPHALHFPPSLLTLFPPPPRSFVPPSSLS